MKDKICFLVLMSIFLFGSCFHRQEVREQNVESKAESMGEGVPFLKGTSFYYNSDDSLLEDNGFYRLTYRFEMELFFNRRFRIEYEFYEGEMEGALISSGFFEKNHFDNETKISVTFSDYFIYKSIRYKIVCKRLDGSVLASYEGSCPNENYPSQLEFGVKSIQSELEENHRISRLFFYCDVTMMDAKMRLVSLRIIPPSEDSFWDITVDEAENPGEYHVLSPLGFSSHPEYVDNGKYLLQIFFGKYGMIQKPFFIADLYGNQVGPNYGAPIAFVKRAEGSIIELDLQNKESLESLEFLFYEGKNRNATISCFHYPRIASSIDKKELFHLANRGIDANERKKMEHNRTYYYQIRLTYTDDQGMIRYVSVSDKYRVVFQGF